MATTTQAAEQKAAEQKAAEAQAKATGEQEAAAKTAADGSAARIAELEAEVAALREQNAKSEAKAADPKLPEGYVYVVNADGSPIASNPFAPKSWLTKHKHLLPEGAREATRAEHAHAVAKAADLEVAAARRAGV